MADPNGQGGGQQPSEEQIAQMRQQHQAAAVQATAPIVRNFAPASREDSEILQFAQKAIMDQETFGRVIDSASNPDVRAKYPYWGFHLKNDLGETLGTICVGKTFPKIPPGGDASEVMHWLTLFALAMNPVARAVGLSQGYYLEFFQAQEKPKPASAIIAPN